MERSGPDYSAYWSTLVGKHFGTPLAILWGEAPNVRIDEPRPRGMVPEGRRDAPRPLKRELSGGPDDGLALDAEKVADADLEHPDYIVVTRWDHPAAARYRLLWHQPSAVGLTR